MREPLRQAEAEGRGERGRVEFCARCQGAPGGERREVVEVRGLNGLVNGHGINGHGHDSASEEEDEDDNDEVESISSDLERELQDFIPEFYRRALAGENNTTTSGSGSTSRPGGESNIPATSTSSTDPIPILTPTSTSTSITQTQTQPQPQTRTQEERRQQSDRASNLIGTLLLRGYALLSGLCDNEGCYGIPLVGHPRRQASSGGRTTEPSGSGGLARNAGAGRAAGSASGSGTGGQKKECVICGKVWEADGTVSRPSRGSRETEGGVEGRAAHGAAQGSGSDARGAGAVEVSGSSTQAARGAVGSGVGPGSGSGSRQAQGRPNSTSSMLIPQATRMRDISREEAMRIYSGDVDVSAALDLGTSTGEASAGTVGDDRAPPMIASCYAADPTPGSGSPAAGRHGEDKPIPIVSTASGRDDLRQPHGNATTTVINPSGQLDIATTLDSTEQALLSTLEAINRTYLLKSSGSPAEFERFISEGGVRKYVEASAEVMRGLQGVERMRGRMGLGSQTQTRTRQRERERQREWDKEREKRRNYAWRNRDRDLERLDRDLDRECYRDRSISPHVNEFGGRRYYE